MNSTPTHALVAYLAAKQGPAGNLGKKAAQKYIHILSSLSKLDVGYEFSFYTYGPFSRDLASDLDILDGSKVIDVIYNSTNNAYSISGTALTDQVAKELSQEIRAEADRVWALFSGRTAKDLELISTILFVSDEEGISIPSLEMTNRVKALKPKYSAVEINKAQTELEKVKK